MDLRGEGEGREQGSSAPAVSSLERGSGIRTMSMERQRGSKGDVDVGKDLRGKEQLNVLGKVDRKGAALRRGGGG